MIHILSSKSIQSIKSHWWVHDFQERLIQGDTSSVWHVAKAIHKLEVYVPFLIIWNGI